jgi:hypothetical protein
MSNGLSWPQKNKQNMSYPSVLIQFKFLYTAVEQRVRGSRGRVVGVLRAVIFTRSQVIAELTHTPLLFTSVSRLVHIYSISCLQRPNVGNWTVLIILDDLCTYIMKLLTFFKYSTRKLLTYFFLLWLTRFFWSLYFQSLVIYVLPSTDWTSGVWSPAGAEYFSSSLCVQTGSDAHPASYLMCIRGPLPGVKRRRGVTLITRIGRPKNIIYKI